MALTEKGQIALDLIKKFCATGTFSAKDLSEKSGIKVAPASLTALAKHGFLNRLETTPVTYSFDKDFSDNYTEVVEPKKGADNGNLRVAKKAKNDEFYTRREDIEAELVNYRKYFIGKTIFLNCDDPRESEFWKYFERQFGFLQLKKLIATHYEKGGKSYKLEYAGAIDENGEISEANITKTPLEGDGDFRSEECIEILKESDIVVTNPPFSLFREYIDLLIKYDKKFIILGNNNACTYKEIFKLIKENKIWLGHSSNKTMKFYIPESYQAQGYDNGRAFCKVPAISWFTNLPTKNRVEEFSTGARYYDENHRIEDYPKYDNYDAIEVGKVKDIPMDYEGIMGVPVTFLDKYNPDQFNIINGIGRYACLDEGQTNPKGTYGTDVNGKHKYFRILIKNKYPRKPRQ